jgi:hypothetical protein
VTFHPLVITENACVPHLVVPKDLTKSWAYVQACGGTANGRCPNPGDVCRPALPPQPVPSPGEQPSGVWTYCIGQPNPADDAICPSAYPNLRVFVTHYTDTRACAPCTCGKPEGSTCTSMISVYADGACSMELGTLTVSSDTVCLDVSGGSALGSKAATPPVYQPGSCPASDTTTGTFTHDTPVAFCCQD